MSFSLKMLLYYSETRLPVRGENLIRRYLLIFIFSFQPQVFKYEIWGQFQVFIDCILKILDDDPGEQVRFQPEVPDYRNKRHALA